MARHTYRLVQTCGGGTGASGASSRIAHEIGARGWLDGSARIGGGRLGHTYRIAQTCGGGTGAPGASSRITRGIGARIGAGRLGHTSRWLVRWASALGWRACNAHMDH